MRFSVILPTYNRARLLNHAIASALDQSFQDFELLVSNNHSNDETEEVIKSFKDQRVKYFKMERVLSMPEHWDFILRKASGTWVLFLADDDVLLPYCLEYLARCFDRHPDVEVYLYSSIKYFYRDKISRAGNILKFDKGLDYSVTLYDSGKELPVRFKKLNFKNPCFPWACTKRDFLDRIRRKYGRVFFNWSPDISSGLVFLANSRKFGQINLPLGISGKGVYSYGSGAREDPNILRDYLSQIPEFKGEFLYTPYPDLFLVSNTIVDTYYKVKFELLREELEGVDMNQVRICLYMLKDLERYYKRGVADYDEFYDRIKHDMFKIFLQQPADLSIWLKYLYKRKIYPYLVSLKRKFNSKDGKMLVSGLEVNPQFSNIFEARHYFIQNCNPMKDPSLDVK